MLSAAQLQTLQTDIQADPVLSQLPHTLDAAFEIVAAYTLPASPVFWVWKTSVSEHTLLNEAGPEDTTFNFQGNGFITRSAGEHMTWSRMFGITGLVNPSLPHVRAAIADILSGTGNAAANRTHCLAQSRRPATRAERLFATGVGSTASPGTMSLEGRLAVQDVQAARALP